MEKYITENLQFIEMLNESPRIIVGEQSGFSFDMLFLKIQSFLLEFFDMTHFGINQWAEVFNRSRHIIMPLALICAVLVLIRSIGWDFDKDK